MAFAMDLTGQVFGRLTARLIDRSGKRIRWVCDCECGGKAVVAVSDLIGSHTRSCGCLWRETVPGHNASHRRTGSYLHRIWGLMIQRCHNPNNPAYPKYGGRGIVVCQRWRESFEAFAADMGERPTDRHSVERKNNDGNYNPENCVWATRSEQARNRKSSRLLTLDGVTRTAAEWSEITGLMSWTIRQRIDRYGWTVERALTTPA
jgi:hypothetical protein